MSDEKDEEVGRDFFANLSPEEHRRLLLGDGRPRVREEESDENAEGRKCDHSWTRAGTHYCRGCRKNFKVYYYYPCTQCGGHVRADRLFRVCPCGGGAAFVSALFRATMPV
jgi:DnaJ-class molecular chaperone